jgi:hypothetical protein
LVFWPFSQRWSKYVRKVVVMGVRSRSAMVLERAGARRARPAGYPSRSVDTGTQALVRAVKVRLAELYGSRLKGVLRWTLL